MQFSYKKEKFERLVFSVSDHFSPLILKIDFGTCCDFIQTNFSKTMVSFWNSIFLCKSPYSVQIRENTDQKNLRT